MRAFALYPTALAGAFALASCATGPSQPQTATDAMIANNCAQLIETGCAGNDPERDNIIANISGMWGGENSCYAQRQRCLREISDGSKAASSDLEARLAAAQDRMKSGQATVDALSAEIASIEQSNAALREALSEMRFANAQQQAQLEQARSQLATIEAQTTLARTRASQQPDGLTAEQQADLDDLEARRARLTEEVEALSAAFRASQQTGN